MITGLLLAAGGARRFGSQKLLAELDGKPLVCHAAETLAGATDTLVAVVGNDGAAVKQTLRNVAAIVVENPQWETGLASSLRTGVAALEDGVSAVVVLLGDEPRIDQGLIREVMAVWRATGSPIVSARYRGVWAHPVLFDRSVFPELLALEGDHGAKPVILRDETRVTHVDVDADPPRDVDTSEDLARLSETD